MAYKVRNGIVKLRICGVTFLTPTRKEMNNCSPVMPLDFFKMIIWKMLSDEKQIDDIYVAFQKLLNNSKNGQIDAEKIKEIVDSNLNDFIENGYVLATEE